MPEHLAVMEGSTRDPAARDDVAGQLMQVIAANPNVGAENIRALIEGVKEALKIRAEQDFTAAFARLKFPPIRKTAKSHNSKYAPFEEIQEVIDPILAAEGFTLTFSSGESNAKGDIPTLGLLSHIGGHSRTGVIYLPPDVTATRSGGTTMNALQSVGSNTSYGMRYVAKMMLNLRFIGDDDDGGGARYISKEQAEEIEHLLVRSAANREKFLAIYGAKSLGDLFAVNFRAAVAQLEEKLRKKEAQVKDYNAPPDPMEFPDGARITIQGSVYERAPDGSAWRPVK